MAIDNPTTVLVPGAPTRSETSVKSALPNLRLHHLFALTAVLAVMLAISRPRYQFASDHLQLSSAFQTAMVAFGILYAMIASAAVTIAAYGIVWRRQGMVFFNQPGHWLIAEVAIATVLGFVVQLAIYLISGAPMGDFDASWIGSVAITITSLGVMIVRVALNIYIGVTKCVRRRWSWVFYLKALASIIQVLGDMTLLIMLSRAPLIDRRQRLERDALHHSGVLIQIVLSLMTVLMTVLFMFAFALGWWRVG